MGQPVVFATLLLLLSQDIGRHSGASGATCDSQDVTDPTSRRDSTGWVSEDLGAGERRQGHISGRVVAWDMDVLVVYGGTGLRNDDVNDVLATSSNLSVFTNADEISQSWTQQLEMISECLRLGTKYCLNLKSG